MCWIFPGLWVGASQRVVKTSTSRSIGSGNTGSEFSLNILIAVKLALRPIPRPLGGSKKTWLHLRALCPELEILLFGSSQGSGIALTAESKKINCAKPSKCKPGSGCPPFQV